MVIEAVAGLSDYRLRGSVSNEVRMEDLSPLVACSESCGTTERDIFVESSRVETGM